MLEFEGEFVDEIVKFDVSGTLFEDEETFPTENCEFH